MTYVRLILAALLSVLWLPATAQPHSSTSMPGQAGEAIAPDGAAAKTDSIVVLTAEEYRRLICGSDMRAERRRAWRRERIDRHELRAGIGSLGIISYLLVDGLYGCCYDMAYRGFRDQMISAGIYTTPEWFTGNIAASYVYHGRRSTQFGVMAAFAGIVSRRRSVDDDRTIGNDNRYVLSVMPMWRGIWLDRPVVQVYSSAAAGVAVRIGQDISPRVLPIFDVALVGCSFGRALFGYVELGSGAGGILRCGVGYRFDAAAKTKRSRR